MRLLISKALKIMYTVLLWKDITVSLLLMKVLGIQRISLFYPWCIHLYLADIGHFSHIIHVQLHKGKYYQLLLQSITQTLHGN